MARKTGPLAEFEKHLTALDDMRATKDMPADGFNKRCLAVVHRAAEIIDELGNMNTPPEAKVKDLIRQLDYICGTDRGGSAASVEILNELEDYLGSVDVLSAHLTQPGPSNLMATNAPDDGIEVEEPQYTLLDRDGFQYDTEGKSIPDHVKRMVDAGYAEKKADEQRRAAASLPPWMWPADMQQELKHRVTEAMAQTTLMAAKSPRGVALTKKKRPPSLEMVTTESGITLPKEDYQDIVARHGRKS